MYGKVKKSILMIIVVALICLSVIQGLAATIYIVDGYSYNIITNTSIAICGWDNSTTELVIPEEIAGRHVTSIADDALRDNQVITSVDFSNATYLETIGLDSFNGCTALQGELILPESVTSIGRGAFRNCPLLQSVDIQANTEKITEQAFYNCAELESIVLSNSVTLIEGYAFANCPKLSYVEIPASVERIYKTAFKNDSNISFGVYYNSYAYRYAKDNNIPYTLLDEFKLADVNMDGIVNINDVTAIQRDLAELEQFNELQELAADANRDGFVDISDATAIQMFLAEYEIPYPIGETITA